MPARVPGHSTGEIAGLVQLRTARSTGKQVGVYDGEAAGMDTAAGRWQTVCEEHGWIISHQSKRLAKYHAAAPEEWCEKCMPGAGA